MTICPAFTRMEVFFDSFCARVAMMVSRSSPSSSFMVHMPSSVKYTSMPIRFKSRVCWRVSTVFLANLDTSLVTIKSKCLFYFAFKGGSNGKTSQNSIDLSFILWYHVLTKLEVVKVRVKELNKNFTTRLCLGMVW